MANWLVLDEAWDGIKAHPDLHDQQVWAGVILRGRDRVIPKRSKVTQERMPACGTKCCLAGWIIHQQAPVGSVITGVNNPQLIMPDGSSRPVSQRAREIAELTVGQADALFYNTASADDLRVMLDYLRQHDDATSFDLRIVLLLPRSASGT